METYIIKEEYLQLFTLILNCIPRTCLSGKEERFLVLANHTYHTKKYSYRGKYVRWVRPNQGSQGTAPGIPDKGLKTPASLHGNSFVEI